MLFVIILANVAICSSFSLDDILQGAKEEEAKIENKISNFFDGKQPQQQQQQQSGTCSTTQLANCAHVAKLSLNLKAQSSAEAKKEISELLKQNDGYLKICRANEDLRKCVTSQNVNIPTACIIVALANAGISGQDAAEFISDYVEIDEACHTFASNSDWQCYQRTIEQKATEIGNCATEKEFTCGIIQKQIKCFQGFFEKPCGAQLSSAACSLQDRVFKRVIPEAQSCTIPCRSSTSTYGLHWTLLIVICLTIVLQMHSSLKKLRIY